MDGVPELSVRHLRAIVALARFESFVAAATYLKISQSGLTRLVQQAERRIGVQLFHRGRRRVLQTDAGGVIARAAERILSDLAVQVQSARSLDGELRGQVTISSLISVSHRVLPRALVRFRREHPSIRVHVRVGVGDDVYNDVSQGQVDFGIADVDGAPSGLSVAAAAEEACFLVLPNDHPMTGSKSIQLKQLTEEQLISMPPESGLRKAIDLAANSQGIALNHSMIINQFDSLFELVGNGLGVAIAPAVALPAADHPAIAIKPLRPKITRRIGILHPKDRPLTSVAATFLAILQPIFLASIK